MTDKMPFNPNSDMLDKAVVSGAGLAYWGQARAAKRTVFRRISRLFKQGKNVMENKPSHEFIDHHMTTTVESVMTKVFKNQKGALASKTELADFIRSMPLAVLVNTVRSHDYSKSLQVQLKDDAEILRWAKTVADA
ncbi:MAG: hypothetical protein EOO81_12920 [Oxalobacteraceae bacterium]|nr:MAG: hypothetical protein EOO81_12920 [Oxalobacteraceae bacterium]